MEGSMHGYNYSQQMSMPPGQVPGQPGTSTQQQQQQWMHHHHQQQTQSGQMNPYHMQAPPLINPDGHGNVSGIQHGHVSPTRSGSISSHSNLMSPPPQSNGGKFQQPKSPASFSGPTKPPKAPEKPLIPYLRFSKSVWESVKKANPGMQFADIGKIIGEQWRNCPADVKQKFSDEYLKDKERYAQAQKAYLESPEYLEWLNAKSRREQHEDEERKRRESSVSSAVSPSRSGYSQHASSGTSSAETFQQPLHGPLEEMQSMSQRIIPPKVALSVNRDVVGDLADDVAESDDCLRAKHVASARYRRNHRLLAEVFSDAIVPDGRMIVNEQRMNLLRKQVASLTHHQDRLIVEQRELVERHETKKQKLLDDSESFAQKYAKVKEDCKPASKEQFQALVDKYSKILEKQWADLQSQNLAKQHETVEREESQPRLIDNEPQHSKSDESLNIAAPFIDAESQNQPVTAETAPAEDVEAESKIEEHTPTEVNSEKVAEDSSEIVNEMGVEYENMDAETDAVPGNIPGHSDQDQAMEIGKISDVGIAETIEDVPDSQKVDIPNVSIPMEDTPLVEFPVSFEKDSKLDSVPELTQEFSATDDAITEITERLDDKQLSDMEIEPVRVPIIEEPEAVAETQEVSLEEEPMVEEVSQALTAPAEIQKETMVDGEAENTVVAADQSPGSPATVNVDVDAISVSVCGDIGESLPHTASPEYVEPELLSPKSSDQEVLSPTTGSVQQTLHEMIQSISASMLDSGENFSTGNYADYSL